MSEAGQHLRVDWTASGDTNRRYWRIYLSDDGQLKGRLVTEVDADTREYVIRDVDESEAHVRVLSISLAGLEEDWRKSGGTASVTVTRDETKPSSPNVLHGGLVSGAMGVRVAVDAPVYGDPPQRLEVVRGPSVTRGQVVGTISTEVEGPADQGGERTVSGLLPATPGRGDGGARVEYHARGVTVEGKFGGSATTFSSAGFDLPNHEPTELASIVGATLSGFTSPASTDEWENAAGVGMRLREKPTLATATTGNGWGTFGTSTLLGSSEFLSRYLRAATVTSNVLDLGSVKSGSLECHDEAQRTTENSKSVKLREAAYPWLPLHSGEFFDDLGGPQLTSRLTAMSGGAIRPLEPTLWRYKVGDSTPLTSTWSKYAPSLLVKGRYIQTQFVLSEPVGIHQVSSGRVYVRFHEPVNTILKTKTGADFTAGDLPDCTEALRGIGFRTDTLEIQINNGGTVYTTAALTAV